MTRRVLLPLALAVLCPGAILQAVQPIGSPFPISTCGNCTKQSPAAAAAPSGTFMVVWQAATGAGAQIETVPGRLFSGAGVPRTAEFSVDPSGAGPHADAAVAADPQGSFVAVWSAKVDGQSDVFAQRYTPRGRPVGPVLQVSVDNPAAAMPADDTLPAVAKAADGSFAVAWVSLVPPGNFSDGEPPRILTRRFSPTGVPLGPAVQINDGLIAGDRPDLCLDTAGRPVVAWASVDGYFPFQPSHKGISVRRLTTTGGLAGPELAVAAPDNDDAAAAVACGPGNTFTLAWQGDQGDLAVDRGEIFAQRFSRNARRVGPVFRVNSGTAGDQGHPRLTYDPTGAFAAVWESRADDGAIGVFARRFLGNGTATGTDFAVDSRLSDTLAPEPVIAPLGTAGNFLVVWRDGAAGLFARRFTP